MSYNPKYKCELCPYRYDSQVRYKDHYNNTHLGLRLYDCENCGKKFGTKEGLRRHHKNTHDEDVKLFHCDICDYKTKKPRDLSVHNDSVHLKKKNYQCSDCEKAFTSRQSLKDHRIKIHSIEIKWHECDLCQKSFRSKLSLRIHEQQVHGERKHKCNLCEYKSTTSTNLKLHHDRVHLMTKNFSCEICEKYFYQKYQLQKHMSLIHAGNVSKDLECKVCDFKTTTSRQLKIHHDRVHLETKNFSCEICERPFFSKR